MFYINHTTKAITSDISIAKAWASAGARVFVIQVSDKLSTRMWEAEFSHGF